MIFLYRNVDDDEYKWFEAVQHNLLSLLKLNNQLVLKALHNTFYVVV